MKFEGTVQRAAFSCEHALEVHSTFVNFKCEGGNTFPLYPASVWVLRVKLAKAELTEKKRFIRMPMEANKISSCLFKWLILEAYRPNFVGT